MTTQHFDIQLEPRRELGHGSERPVAVMRVDGAELLAPTVVAVSADQLEQSALRDGEFHIFTCWCGEPACAGVNEGVFVKHVGDTVQWRVVYPGLEQTLRFDRQQYITAVRHAVQQVADAIRAHRTGRGLPLAPDLIT